MPFALPDPGLTERCAQRWRAERSLLIAGAVLIVAGLAVQHLGLDRPWLTAAQIASRTLPDGLWAAFGVAGLGLSVVIVAALASVARQAPIAAMLVALVLGGLMLQAIKRVALLPRPAGVLAPDALHVIGQRLMSGSMPSGHAAAGFALAVLLLCTLPALRRWALPMLALAALSAFSRVAVGAHWPSDVFVGAGLGVIFPALALRLEARWALGRRLATPTGQHLLAAGQVLAGVSLLMLRTGYPSAWATQYALGAASIAGGLWRWRRLGARGAPS